MTSGDLPWAFPLTSKLFQGGINKNEKIHRNNAADYDDDLCLCKFCLRTGKTCS